VNLQNIKKIVVDSLVSVLDENDIKNISVDDNSEIFGSRSIIDSLQLINLIVKIEEDVYDQSGKEIIVVDDEAIIIGNSPFQSVQSLAEFVHKKVESA
jgi:acyl carrier protein